MSSSNRGVSMSGAGAPPDPPCWVGGAPTSRVGQSCALCGTRDVTWVHPLHPDRVAYRQHGKAHTLPTFWTLCDRCEQVYALGDDDAAIALMRAADGWDHVPDVDVEECIAQPLAVFRHADLGVRRLGAT